MNTNGLLKLREDTANTYKLDKKNKQPSKKEVYGYQPPWVKFENGKLLEFSIGEVEAVGRKKIEEREAALEPEEEPPKRFKLLWDIWEALKQLWTFDREVQGK